MHSKRLFNSTTLLVGDWQPLCAIHYPQQQHEQKTIDRIFASASVDIAKADISNSPVKWRVCQTVAEPGFQDYDTPTGVTDEVGSWC